MQFSHDNRLRKRVSYRQFMETLTTLQAICPRASLTMHICDTADSYINAASKHVCAFLGISTPDLRKEYSLIDCTKDVWKNALLIEAHIRIAHRTNYSEVLLSADRQSEPHRLCFRIATHSAMLLDEIHTKLTHPCLRFSIGHGWQLSTRLYREMGRRQIRRYADRMLHE
jgi:hypothetical protein